MSHNICTILQYAAFLRGHGYCDTELQEEIIATLEASDAEPVRLRGLLAKVEVLTQTTKGAPADHLAVTLETSSSKQLLQFAMSDKAGQALVRKLWHAVPAKETEILIWTIADDGSDAVFECGLQYVKVRQAGNDLRGTDTANLWPLVTATQAPFVAAGVTDKVALRVVEDRATLDWHMALLDMTIEKFKAHLSSMERMPVDLQCSAVTADSLLDDDPFGLDIDELPALPRSDG